MLSQFVKQVALELFEGLATPRSLAAAMLLKAGEWDQLATLEVDPDNYLFADDYWRDAQASSFLKKYEPLPTSFDRKAVAESNFRLCEENCLRANRRLYPLLDDLKGHLGQSGVHSFFERARKNIASILGPCPDLVSGRFGPGATFGDRGQMTTVPDKMSNEPTFTTDAWPFLVPWSGTMWASACVDIGKVPRSVPGNRFMTVPKDATKFRGIAVEPSINVFYQLAYGKVIRGRLSRRGVDLDEGQDIHRRLACDASRRGHLATLDLRNASDTISRNLVKLLLPHTWYSVLDSLRSKKTFFNGHWVLLEKFSSMGNGFTFELETLIFLGLISAITGADSIGKDLFVFGDDIILPTEHSEDVIAMLKFCGLETNQTKSFVSGSFRESCGGDFFNGVGVRPFYLKDDPDQPFSRIALANGLKRSSDSSYFRWLGLRSAWHEVMLGIPTSIRCLRGPSALGDIVIHDDDPSRWFSHWKHGIRYIKCYQPFPRLKVRWDRFAPSVTLASAVYGQAWSSGYVLPRNPVLDYRIGAVPFS
jgi:hypothetical protein